MHVLFAGLMMIKLGQRKSLLCLGRFCCGPCRSADFVAKKVNTLSQSGLAFLDDFARDCFHVMLVV